ncbi:MAG: polysaccharide biosynthesis protein [Firmicutes bacterium]|nr:polysaccharide biosynthesis protein [Bacillota bacterium]
MTNHRLKIILLAALDLICIAVMSILALLVRFELDPDNVQFISYLGVLLDNWAWMLLIKEASLILFGIYRSLWRYAGSDELLKVFVACVVGNMGFLTYMAMTQQSMPRSFYIICTFLDVVLIGGIRFIYRYVREYRYPGYFTLPGSKHRGLAGLGSDREYTRVLLVGAGNAAGTVIKEIRNAENDDRRIVALIDDDKAKIGRTAHGIKVVGNRDYIPKAVEKFDIDEIVVAIPSAPKKTVSEILEICHQTKCKVKIMPSLIDLIDNKISVKALRDVEIEDLLGRDQIEVDLKSITGYLSGHVVMVTGGGGSIGSELVRQVAGFGPRRIVVVDIYENSTFELGQEMRKKFPDTDVELCIASVRDRALMEEIFIKYKPHVVFHAAAHKHVPLMEDAAKEALLNNCLGTDICMELAEKYRAEKFVLISTDKAVNPTSVMGASKRICEMLMQARAAAALSRGSSTEFCAVRFGNVLGSNGSVIPIFRRQIAAGGPVTVTHKDITRYFMTIPEAVQLVIQAGAMASGGEIFILDMGEPVKIMDLAEKMIRLSGLEVGKDIDIQVTGLRPGEKLYEELLLSEEGIKETQHGKIFVGHPIEFSDGFIRLQDVGLEESLAALTDKGDEEVRSFIKEIVPNYTGG